MKITATADSTSTGHGLQKTSEEVKSFFFIYAYFKKCTKSCFWKNPTGYLLCYPIVRFPTKNMRINSFTSIVLLHGFSRSNWIALSDDFLWVDIHFLKLPESWCETSDIVPKNARHNTRAHQRATRVPACGWEKGKKDRYIVCEWGQCQDVGSYAAGQLRFVL